MSLIKGLPKKPESTESVVDISTMSNIELLKYIMDNYHDKYKKMEIKNRSRYSTCRDFYQGVGRGFYECQRVIAELIGRLENSNEESNLV